jgi:hypothetical protein
MVAMDPKLVAATQAYELNYFARKHNITRDQARKILAKVGVSRAAANVEALKLKHR